MIALPRISDYPAHFASVDPQRQAIVHRERRWTGGAFAVEVERWANALMAAGVKPGERVAMLVPPRPEFLFCFLATAMVGGIWVGLNPRYRIGELRHVMTDTSPALLIAQREIDGRNYSGDLTALQTEFPALRSVICLESLEQQQFLEQGQKVSPSDFAGRRADVKSLDTCAIIFTSGSTGAPKGAMLSHHGLVHGALIEHRHSPSNHPVVLCNQPVSNIAGLGISAGYGVVVGGTLVFQEHFDPGEVLAAIAKERVTHWIHSPVTFHFVVNHPDFATTDFSSLDYIIWGGAAMAESLVRSLTGTGAKLRTAFGMTELSNDVTFTGEDASIEELTQTIGRPDPDYDLRIADHEGRPVPTGETGEIQARGDWIFRGYFNRPESTAEATTPDGWFRTGDLAVERPDGNWQIVGRLKDVYKSGGYSIYPREIEIALEAHPAVALAAVIGVSDPVYGEVGHAFVQNRQGSAPDEEMLKRWCHERMANFKVPKRVTILPELPRLAIGKVDKIALKQMTSAPAEG